MHSEFLLMAKDGGDASAKMSKSAGGFVRLQTLIDEGYDPLAYRYFCLNAHYRAQLAFSWESLAAAANAFERLRARAIELREASAGAAGKILDGPMNDFRTAVRDDLNMPRALAAMWGLLRETDAPKADVWATLLAMDAVLGFGVQTLQARKADVAQDEAAKIEQLIAERNAARKAGNFARADEIRKELAALNITIKDPPKSKT